MQINSQTLDFIIKFTSISGNIIGFLVWWDSSRGKRFAAQQAFQQIKEDIIELENGQQKVLEAVERHETNTFKNYTEVTNKIFRDLDISKQLLNNIWVLLAPENSTGRKKND